MIVGVVADTHLPRFGRLLPAALLQGLAAAGVDLIVHLGDFTTAGVASQLERIALLEAVAGNNDGPELIARFGRRKILEIDAVRIGLTHGDLGSGARTVDRAVASFAGERLDAVLFGHSHAPLLEYRNGVLLLNPGSPTDRRREPEFSYAVLEIVGGRPRAELRTYRDRSPG